MANFIAYICATFLDKDFNGYSGLEVTASVLCPYSGEGYCTTSMAINAHSLYFKSAVHTLVHTVEDWAPNHYGVTMC